MKTTILMIWLLAASHLHSQSVKDSLLEIYAGQVFFETNKSDIEDQHKEIIKSLCDSLPNTKGKYFFIKAHTDAVGNSDDNLSLSEKRSLSIKMELIANGIQESDIQTEYYGDQKPQSDNQSEEGKRLNRRAEISVRKKFKLKELSGIIISDSSEIKDAMVLVSNKIFIDSVQTTPGGKFKIFVPIGQMINIDVLAPDHFSIYREVFTNAEAFVRPLEIQILPIRMNQILLLKEIQFIGNTSIVLSKSRSAQESLVFQLRANKNHCFEIAGHINQPGPYVFPIGKTELSNERAYKIYEHLVKSNIDSTRIIPKGYGNLQMKFPKPKNPDEDQANRRVEIIIRDCDTIRKRGK